MDSAKCDSRLPDLALAFRKEHGLLDPADFARYNVTVWWVRHGHRDSWIVEKNTTIAELRETHGPAPEPSSEVGFHSEMLAYERLTGASGFLRGNSMVVQIFTEREPCTMMCKPMLKWKLPNVPVFYYIPEQSDWWNMTASAKLRAAYQL